MAVSPLRDHRILVVEDEYLIAATLSDQLEGVGSICRGAGPFGRESHKDGRPRQLQRPRQARPRPRSMSRHPRQVGRNLDLAARRSLSDPPCATIRTITCTTTHGGTGIATIATTPWRAPRPELPAASPTSVRLPPIRSTASRTTGPAESVCPIAFEASGWP